MRGHDWGTRCIGDLHLGGSSNTSGRCKPRFHDTQQRCQTRLRPRTDAHQIRRLPLVRSDRLTCLQRISEQRAQVWSVAAYCDSLKHAQCLEAYSLVTVRELIGSRAGSARGETTRNFCGTGQSTPTSAQPAAVFGSTDSCMHAWTYCTTTCTSIVRSVTTGSETNVVDKSS